MSLHLITPTLFGEGHKLRSSSLCTSVHPPVPSVSGTNDPLCILFSTPGIHVLPYRCETKFHTHTNEQIKRICIFQFWHGSIGDDKSRKILNQTATTEGTLPIVYGIFDKNDVSGVSSARNYRWSVVITLTIFVLLVTTDEIEPGAFLMLGWYACSYNEPTGITQRIINGMQAFHKPTLFLVSMCMHFWYLKSHFLVTVVSPKLDKLLVTSLCLLSLQT